ncbi:MAG: nucleoside hydrolase [Pirellulaceae bacterium]|nr:MAG: nucleoside hydrolase [Pirellulaceae bacterium]
MPRKVVLVCDPGIDDAVLLALALFDPRLEIVGIAATAGTVDTERTTRNVSTLVERLDPPRIPRLGAAIAPEPGAAVSGNTALHGRDGLGNVDWTPVSRQHILPSDKLIADCLRADPGAVSLVCTGPLTPVAKAFSRDPTLPSLVDRIVIAGGTAIGVGDVSAVAEFNIHFDPVAAKSVFESPTTKSLLPLEVTNQLSFGWELIEQLPPRYTPVGAVLHSILPAYFRATHQVLGRETVSLQAIVPLLVLTDPVLVRWEEMAGRVETYGELTTGATIFDRRDPPQWRANMEVAVGLDVDSARDVFYNLLKFAARH